MPKKRRLSTKAAWSKRRGIIDRYMRYIEHAGGRIPAHDYDFNKATALLSERIAKKLGADKAVQSQAFVAGFMHDRVRHLSNVPHAGESGTVVKQLLEKRYGKQAVARIVKAAKLHNKVPANLQRNMVWASVALADMTPKFGPIGAFRRSLFQAQKKENLTRIKAAQRKAKGRNAKQIEKELALQIIIERTDVMTKKHWKPEKQPRFMQKHMQRQFELHQRFRKGIAKKEKWAVNLALKMYEAGKKDIPLKEAIEKYKPVGRIDREFKKQAMLFINSPEKLL